MSSITANVSAFARAYHNKHYSNAIFVDKVAGKLLNADEYEKIASNMTAGVKFFFPEFNGTQEEALELIANNYLCPSPIGRAAFAKEELQKAKENGINQVLILASGLDSFAYTDENTENLSVYELDTAETIDDKIDRLYKAKITVPENTHLIKGSLCEKFSTEISKTCYLIDSQCFCTALGIFYYLSENEINNMLSELSEVMCKGSKLVFDYQDENTYTDIAGERAKKQNQLADYAGEKMKSCFSKTQIKRICELNGFFVEKIYTPETITNNFFTDFNKTAKIKIHAFDNVNYCSVIKKD